MSALGQKRTSQGPNRLFQGGAWRLTGHSLVRSLNMLRGIRGNCQSVLSPGTGRGPSGAFERHVAGHQSTDQPGNNTVSITWMTPFDCMTLRMVTLAEPPLASQIQSRPSFSANVRSAPSTVLSIAWPLPALI